MYILLWLFSLLFISTIKFVLLDLMTEMLTIFHFKILYFLEYLQLFEDRIAYPKLYKHVCYIDLYDFKYLQMYVSFQ